MATYSSSLYKTGYYLKLEVNEQSYSVANNSSTLSWRLYIQTTNGYYFSTIRIGAKVVIDGATVLNRSYSSSNQYSCSANSTVTIASGTTVVSHNADGTKTIAAGQISASNSTGGNVVPNMSLSSSSAMALTTIPRASTITTTAGSTLMGTVRTINITRAADTFTHTLTYTFGSASGTIATKTSSTAVSWTVPTSLASALTNAKSGTGTITCETFNGNTSVGTSTATFTATIPPSTATPANSTTTMGTSLSFTISRAASNLTHTIEYKFGNQSSYTAMASGTTFSTSFSFTSARGNTAALAAYVPTNNSSGSGTMRITTLNGSATVGTSTCAFKLKIPASSFSVSTNPITMGNAQTFTITRAASNITHKLEYMIGGAYGTIGTGIGTSKTWTIPASLAAQVASPDASAIMTVYLTTYNGTAVCGSTVTGTFTATIPTSTYTLSSTSVYAGTGSITVNISRAATTLVHTVQYSADNSSWTTIGTAKTSSTSVTWSPTYTLIDDIPGTSATYYLRVITYNGSSATTSVGNIVKTITVKVPNNSTTKPTISSVTLTPYSSLSSPFNTIFIQGYTRVRAAVSASGKYSATIANYALTISGTTKSGSSSTQTTDGAVSVSGTVSVKVTVTDSRGFTASSTQSITVYAYSTPTVVPYTGNTSIIAARATSTGTVSKSGTYLHIECGRKISTLAGNNQGKIEYVLLNRDNQQIATGTLSANNAAASRYATFTSSTAVVEDLTKTYTVQIIATDTFGSTTTYTVGIPTDEVTMDLRRYGMGIGFGQYSTSYKTFEIAPDWGVHGRVYGLGWLPQVPADADLNSYRTPGRYAVFGSVVSSLSNLPYGATQGGVLTVISSLGNAYYDIEAQSNVYLIQEYRTYDGSYEWERVLVGNAGSWAYGGWRRLYPQANASSVPLTYVSNSGITSANFSSGFSLYQSGVNCILYVNAAPASAAVTSFTTIGTIPEGARPNAAVVQNTNAQNSTSFVEVAIRLSTDGNIQLYSPGTQTSRIQMVIPYFTNL